MIFGSDGATYNFPIPGACAGAASLFNNSLREYTRPGHGTYCGTTNGGYYTIGKNASESTQAYIRASDDITPNLQVFAEALFNHDVQRYAAGGNFYSTQSDASPGNPFYYYYDPNLGDEVNVQRFFAPEEAGSINEFLNKNTNNSIRGTIGVEGSFGSSSWKYSVDMTYTENKLTERTRVGTEAGLTAWFASIAGPELDPSLNLFGDGDKVYAPNYADFYKPVTPAQYAALIPATGFEPTNPRQPGACRGDQFRSVYPARRRGGIGGGGRGRQSRVGLCPGSGISGRNGISLYGVRRLRPSVAYGGNRRIASARPQNVDVRPIGPQ